LVVAAMATLTEAAIAQAMARAAAVARSRSRDPAWVHELADPLDHVLASLTEDGWCQVGSLTSAHPEPGWHVWLNVHTGAGRLRRWDH